MSTQTERALREAAQRAAMKEQFVSPDEDGRVLPRIEMPTNEQWTEMSQPQRVAFALRYLLDANEREHRTSPWSLRVKTGMRLAKEALAAQRPARLSSEEQA